HNIPVRNRPIRRARPRRGGCGWRSHVRRSLMLATRWFRLPRFASPSSARAGHEKGSQAALRPCLESLEDRVCPATIFESILSNLSASVATFGLFSQTETVTVHVDTQEDASGPITPFDGTPTGGLDTQQQVAITDGGKTQMANIDSNGNASSTF